MQGTTMKTRGRKGWLLGGALTRALSLGLIALGLYLLLGGPHQHSTVAGSAATPVAALTAQRTAPMLATRSIEQIQVGDRVLAGNPEGAADEADVDPPTWRKITLVMHSHDVDVDVTLLRPLTWIESRGAVVGGTVELNLPEMDMVGPARVLAIDTCPRLVAGSGRVVTGTFAHDDATVLDLWLEGLADPIGVTANHSIYSEDRHAFVKAGDLRSGERLLPLGEPTRVVSISPRPGEHKVYNLEVSLEHAYRVTSLGVLVHNSCYEDISDLRITNKVGAGAARPPRHHLFPQQFRQWFADRGINIDRVTIALDQGTHSAIHKMGWNDDLMSALQKAEKETGRTLSAREIWRIAMRQAREYKLRDLTFIPYFD